MKKYTRLFFQLSIYSILFTASFLIPSCSNPNEVRVDSTNFEEEIDLRQNLVFNFNHDLVGDSLLNQWMNEKYISISPSVPGKFKWISKNSLQFSPEKPFAASTEYTAELTDTLTIHQKTKFAVKQGKPLTFHTPYLKVISADPVWTRPAESPTSLIVRTTVRFNYVVNPGELGSFLSLESKGKDIPFTVSTASPEKDVTLSIEEKTTTGLEGEEVRLVIKPGFRTVESSALTKTELVSVFVLPKKEGISILSVMPVIEDGNALIRVKTNQTVTDASLASLISTDPEVGITIEKEEDGFLIKGNFNTGRNYTLKISGKLKGLFGPLGDDYEQAISFAEPEPHISFPDKSNMYMSSQSGGNIAVSITSIPKVRIRIMKVFENNLTFMANRSQNYYWDEESYNSTVSRNLDATDIVDNDLYGVIVSDKVIETRLLPKQKGTTLLKFPIPVQDGLNGIFIVLVESTTNRWERASTIVAYSDIALIAKKSEKGLHVFAVSIKTAEPAADVQLSVISQNNQLISKVKTDKNGVAVISDYLSKAPDFTPVLISAQKGTDFNFILFSNTQVEMSRFDVGGFRENLSGYLAFLYPERNIYRPGETINLAGIIRNEEWKPISSIPFKIKILQPNGQELSSSKITTDEQGGFEFKQAISQSSMTGKYSAEIYGGNDVLLNTVAISIEEFIPDRISVATTLSKELLKPGEVLTVKGSALNLFGPPAVDRNYETELSVVKIPFRVKNLPDYQFEVKTRTEPVFNKDLRQGKTSETGSFEQTFQIPADYVNSGLLQARVFTTVFDENGRPVNRLQTANIQTQPVFFGIRKIDEYVGTRVPLQIPVIAVDLKGNIQSGVKAKVQVIRSIWETVLVKNDWGGYRYQSQELKKTMLDNVITLSGDQTMVTFNPLESGDYEVRIGIPGSDTWVSRSFYAYRYGDTESSSFAVNTEGLIDIKPDKDLYESGEKAEILFTTPFPGKLLVTVERNKMTDYFWLETDKKTAKLTLPVKPDYLPNVYISATLFRPLDSGALPLKVAHGYANIAITRSSQKLPVSIVAEDLSRSNKTQIIKVKTESEKNIQVTLAVVDEGILQVKDFVTPDPFAWFFQKRALAVQSYDFFASIYPDLQFRNSTGGDKYNLNKRINPMTARRTQLVSFWSGILKTDKNGEAAFPVSIPQFSGSLRIMAVVYKGNQFGSAEKTMKVADPVIISTALPRFLSPGDSIVSPVMLANTLKTPQSVTVTVKTEGPIRVNGESTQTVLLKAESEEQPVFRFAAKPEPGIGKIIVSVKSGGETMTETTELSVRPVSGLRKFTGSGVIKSGENKTITFPAGLLPSTTDRSVIITKSPAVELKDRLDQLISYPHGCTEQTVSAAFPLLYLEDLSKFLKAGSFKDNRINDYIQTGIQTVLSRQLYNGGIALWPGYDEANWWSSAYAAHFLYEAKRAGYEVSQSGLNNLLQYLSNRAKSRERTTYYYYDRTDKLYSKSLIKRETIYSLYVLSLAGNPDLSGMNYFRNNQNELTEDSRYLLACSFLLAGDASSYRSLVPKEFGGSNPVQESGNSFSSAIRDLALILNALIDSDPNSATIPELTRLLTQQIKTDPWMNTQELAFSTLALGKLAKATEGQATVMAVQETKQLGEMKGTDLQLKKLGAGPVSLKASGNGVAWFYWEAEGVPESGFQEAEDKYLQVRRSFLTRNGGNISSNTFRQNDLIVVRLTVKTLGGVKADNVVITDLLPAGLEIENPRINAARDMDWIKDANKPDYFDVRDDRISFYTDLNSNQSEKTFYYLVRAVTRGTFKLGHASADAMYLPEYRSYNGAGIIRVIQ